MAGRLAVLAAHVRPPSCTSSNQQPAAATAASGDVDPRPSVPPSAPSLRDGHRDNTPPLPGVTGQSRSTAIRLLQPSDEDAYAAFGGRMQWRAGWHYPMSGIPTSFDTLRSIARRQGTPLADGGGELRLVLVETQTEVHGGKAYSWDEIYGESWYSWGGGAEQSTFGLNVNEAFQGTGAGRALTERCLWVADMDTFTQSARRVADESGYGPRTMSLTVQDINERAWKLCKCVPDGIALQHTALLLWPELDCRLFRR